MAEQATRWYTVEEAAALCHRKPHTIYNLISKHQLPRRSAWKVHQRMRRRIITLSPATVSWLQQHTLFGDSRALKRTKLAAMTAHHASTDDASTHYDR